MTDRFGRTTIRIHDDLSLDLSDPERRRLLVRVLCELVAYESGPRDPNRLDAADSDITLVDEGSTSRGDAPKPTHR